ncbi:MAG TPA: porin [Candidatus Duodenibacillus intestinavium]|nr:porin [Candidatus Duodenibacillus intestinavium]
MTKFKTTLLAMAVSAAAFSVQAAQVSLYGSVSTGVLYQNQASLSGGQGATNQESKDSFTMESGFWGDSIWGITGEEDLGNGWTVGFTLENEFGSDTGEMASDGTIFDSQAYLRIGNDKVNFAFGNIGGLSSAGGDFDLICGFDPMEAFVGVAGLGAFASKDYASGNMAVVEVTPMEGLKVSLMGNTGDDDSSEAKWSDRDHYYGLGVSYESGPLALAAIAEMRKYDKKAERNNLSDNDNSWTFTVAAAYDFEVIRPSFVYQHASKTREFGASDPSESSGAYNFDSFMLGATAPLGQGTLRASVQYVKGENDAVSDEEGSATILGLAYTYDMSKRTTLYGAAFYSVGGDGLDKDLGTNEMAFGLMDRAEYNSVGFGVGLVHTF